MINVCTYFAFIFYWDHFYIFLSIPLICGRRYVDVIRYQIKKVSPVHFWIIELTRIIQTIWYIQFFALPYYTCYNVFFCCPFQILIQNLRRFHLLILTFPQTEVMADGDIRRFFAKKPKLDDGASTLNNSMFLQLINQLKTLQSTKFLLVLKNIQIRLNQILILVH